VIEKEKQQRSQKHTRERRKKRKSIKIWLRRKNTHTTKLYISVPQVFMHRRSRTSGKESL